MTSGFSFGSGNTAGGSLFGQSGGTSSGGFSFGSSNKTQPTAFTFPTSTTTAASTGFGGFGAKASQPTNLFGANTTGFGAKTTGSNLFGGSTGFGAKTTAPSLFSGSAFGVKTTSSSLFSGGASAFSLQPKQDANKGGLFGQQQQPTQTQPDNAASVLLATATALSAPLVFGDERDAIMTKWNQIQAFWGVGRGYYRKDGAFIDFTPQNHFCRFKAVGYSCLPTAKDQEGLVAIVVNKKQPEMLQIGEAKIEEAIHKIMGNNQTLKVKVDSIRLIPGDKTEITIYVSEQSGTTGIVRRVPASELYKFMQQTNIQQQLKQQVLMETCVPRVEMTEEQIQNILANPPAGIDPVVWEQAKRDNPDPKTLIPVPMIGFTELRNRLRLQELMSKQHQSRLDILSKGLHNMQQEQVGLQSKIEQHRRKLLEMSHRVLQIVIAQEICRKAGFAIQLEEEQLRVHLESIYNELNAPTQFRGRLNELLSQTRLHHHSGNAPISCPTPTSLDQDALNEINHHLRKQQEGLNTLVAILRDDMNDLKLIEAGLRSDESLHQHFNRR